MHWRKVLGPAALAAAAAVLTTACAQETELVLQDRQGDRELVVETTSTTTVATSTPTGDAAAVDVCASSASIASVGTPGPALGDLDPERVAADNSLAALPVEGPRRREVLTALRYEDAEDYVNRARIARPDRRLAAMRRDGFRGGTDVKYVDGEDRYGVIVLRFADQPSALDYLDVHVGDICSTSHSVERLTGLPGVAYLRDDGLAKAVFVVGDAEIAVDVCACVEDPDRVAVATRWAAAIAEQLSDP